MDGNGFDEIDDGQVDAGSHPIEVAASWLAEARSIGLPQAGAFSLATTGPSLRTVQALRFDHEGVLFTTHARSPKMQAIGSDPNASALFHWPELGRQVIINGTAQVAGSAIADEEWKRRTDVARRLSSVIHQSEPITDRQDLLDMASAVRSDVARPEGWVAVRLIPSRIEFWRAGQQSLHLRDEFRLVNDTESSTGTWAHRMLQP